MAEQTRGKWPLLLSVIGGLLLLAAVLLPMGGHGPHAKSLLENQPVLAGLMIVAAMMGAWWGRRGRAWHVGVVAVVIYIMGRMAFGEFSFDPPDLDPARVIDRWETLAYLLFKLGCLALLCNFVVLKYYQLAAWLKGRLAKAGEITQAPSGLDQAGPGNQAPGQVPPSPVVLPDQLYGTWRMTGANGADTASAAAELLNTKWEFSPKGWVKVTLWGMGSSYTVELQGNRMILKPTRGRAPQEWTILSLSRDTMVLRRDDLDSEMSITLSKN